jgi:endonuclease YncB( thermonuclease family)
MHAPRKTPRRSLALLAALALLLPSAAAAASRFEGRVVRVKDGDSLLVERTDVKRVSEVRLAGIDAPELAQPWGIQSRTGLRRIVQGKPVTVEITDRDRYGRLVARVWQGRAYVNAAMTLSGNAWAFDRYLPDRAIRDGQAQAQAQRRGLWALPPEQRLPPATWRARHPRSGA